MPLSKGPSIRAKCCFMVMDLPFSGPFPGIGLGKSGSTTIRGDKILISMDGTLMANIDNFDQCIKKANDAPW